MYEMSLENLGIYTTAALIEAIKLKPVRHTFLRDRYFPTDPMRDMFKGPRVIVEYKDGNRLLAPCVLPRRRGLVIERAKSHVNQYIPPLLAPKRVLTSDDIEEETFAELKYGLLDPDQKEKAMLAEDLEYFSDMLDGREEYMAAEVLMNNGCALSQYAENFSTSDSEEWEIRFYDEDTNPARYIPAAKWDKSGAKIYEDLKAMVRTLVSKGLAATEAVMAPDVSDVILHDEWLLKLLDTRNVSIGSIAPLELPSGAAHFGTINLEGRMLKLITYDETYDEITSVVKGKPVIENKPYLPSGTIVVTAPASGHCMYGSVDIMGEDKVRRRHAEKRVPKVDTDTKNEVRELTVFSRPILAPLHKNPWISATVL